MKNDKGFTLAELLIVVAIIAVLVAVSIPIFTAQLEKSREATDIANFRAAKAAFIVAVLDGTISAKDAEDKTKFYYHAGSGSVSTDEVDVPYGEGTKTNPYKASPDDGTYPAPYDAGDDYSSAVIYAVYSKTYMKESLEIHWVNAETGEELPFTTIDLSNVTKPVLDDGGGSGSGSGSGG